MVKTGSSYCSQSELPLTFGLGAADRREVDRDHVAERHASRRSRGPPPTRRSRSRKARASSPRTRSAGRHEDAARWRSLRLAHGAGQRIHLPQPTAAPPMRRRARVPRQQRRRRAARAVRLRRRGRPRSGARCASSRRSPRRRLNLAIALFYAGHPDDARARRARRGRRAARTRRSRRIVLGLIAKAQNRPADAIAAFRRVLRHRSRRRRHEGASRPGRSAAAEDSTRRSLRSRTALVARAVQRDRGVWAGAPRCCAADKPTRPGATRCSASRRCATAPYGVTYAQGYLQQGRYAEAIVSTGAEAGAGGRSHAAASTFTDATPAQPRRVAADRQRHAARCRRRRRPRSPRQSPPTALRLYRNDGGRFADATAAAALDARSCRARRLAAVAGDYDNDGRPDLFVLRDRRRSRCCTSAPTGRFEDVTRPRRCRRPARLSRAAAFVDVDHDGDLDIVMARVPEPRRSCCATTATARSPTSPSAAGIRRRRRRRHRRRADGFRQSP